MAVIQMTYNDKTYDLPKYTIGIADRMADINETVEYMSKAQKMYAFISDVIGAKDAKAFIGEKLEDMDLLELLGLYDSIDVAYADAIKGAMYNEEELNEVTAAINKLGGIENVITLLNALNK